MVKFWVFDTAIQSGAHGDVRWGALSATAVGEGGTVVEDATVASLLQLPRE